MSTIRYFVSGFDKILFQWSFAVVQYEVGVYIGLFQVSFSRPIIVHTLCVALF